VPIVGSSDGDALSHGGMNSKIRELSCPAHSLSKTSVDALF
jgi:hypothetical protein